MSRRWCRTRRPTAGTTPRQEEPCFSWFGPDVRLRAYRLEIQPFPHRLRWRRLLGSKPGAEERSFLSGFSVRRHGPRQRRLLLRGPGRDDTATRRGQAKDGREQELPRTCGPGGAPTCRAQTDRAPAVCRGRVIERTFLALHRSIPRSPSGHLGRNERLHAPLDATKPRRPTTCRFWEGGEESRKIGGPRPGRFSEDGPAGLILHIVYIAPSSHTAYFYAWQIRRPRSTLPVLIASTPIGTSHLAYAETCLVSSGSAHTSNPNPIANASAAGGALMLTARFPQ